MESNVEDILRRIQLGLTDEYFNELAKKCYEEDREYPENFSNWYPYIENFGTFNHSEIISNQIFTFEEVEIMQKEEHIEDVDWNEWYKILKPTLEKMKPRKII